MSRLPIKAETIRRLFALSGNKCAFEGCDHELVNAKGTFIGQICHIEAANEGGERYNPNQTDEERRSFENLMLLCYRHHKESNDVEEYPVARLREIKKQHEAMYERSPFSVPDHLLASISSEINGQLERIYGTVKETSEDVKRILSLLEKGDVTKPKFDESQIYIAELNIIKELRKENKQRAAIELLKKYKADKWSNLTDELKYKVIVNMAMFLFDLNLTEEGCHEFLKLRHINYKREECLPLIALAYAELKDTENFEKVFKEAKELNPLSINLWIGYISIYKRFYSIEDIENTIPSEIREAPEIKFKLAEIAIKKESLEQSRIYYEKAIAGLSKDDNGRYDIMSSYASEVLSRIVTPYKYQFSLFTEEEISQIKEASDILTEVWEKYKDTELMHYRSYVPLNRGVAFKVLNKKEQALEDLRAAFDLSKSVLAFKNLISMYLDLHMHQRALEFYETNIKHLQIEESDKFDLEITYARILFFVGRFEEAIEKLKPWLRSTASEDKITALNLIITLYFENDNFKDAESYCQQLIEEYPEEVDGYLTLGLIRLKDEVIEEAKNLFIQAAGKISVRTPEHEQYQIAHFLIECKEYKKASELLENLANVNLLNKISKGLIFCYYHLGKIKEAREIALRLFAKYPRDLFLAEILSNIYKEVGDTAQAISFLDKVLQERGENVGLFLLRKALLLLDENRLNDIEGTIELIKDAESFNITDIFQLAYLYAKIGNYAKASAIAYAARHKYYEVPEGHIKYMGVLNEINIKEEDYHSPPVVQEDCAVKLQDEHGSESIYIITSSVPPLRDEISNKDNFAQMLMSKKVGESIEIQKGLGRKHTLTVKAIQNKYTYAYQQSLQLFKNRFAENNSITVFHFNEENPFENFEFIKQQSVESQKFEKDILQFYNQQIISVEFLAGRFHRNIVKQWFHLAHSTEASLICFTRDEGDVVENVLKNKTPVVIDAIALLTLHFLAPEQLKEVELLDAIFVAQSVVEELRDYYSELDNFTSDGFSSLGYHEGRFVVVETTGAEIDNQKRKIQTIIDWCYRRCTVKVSNKLLEIERSERLRGKELLGSSSFESVLLCQDQGAVLLSDDSNLKNYVLSKYSIKGFCVFQLALSYSVLQKLTNEALEDFSFKLISANYIFIPNNLGILKKAFEASGFQTKKPFINAVAGLRIFKPEAALIITVEFFKYLYLNTGLKATRDQAVLFMLNHLYQQFGYEVVKERIQMHIERTFKLLPREKYEILTCIDGYL